MATISFGGLGNGLDFNQVVEQLVKVQRLPVDQLNQKKTGLQSKLTDYGLLGTKLLALQGAADALRLSSSFDRSKTTVSNEDVLTAVGSFTAAAGNYVVGVTQLAQAHQLINKTAKAVAATSTDIVSGASGTFTFRVGSGTAQTVTLSDTATLEDLRSAITDLGAGVSASILNTGTDAVPAYRLVLTSNSTGASNGITIVADNTDLDFLNTSGTGGTDTLQAAQNAIIVLGDPTQNPVTLQRSSNSVSDAVSGVTLTLKQTSGSGTVNVGISRDTGAVKDNIKNLLTAYNDAVKFINERSTYDVTTKKGGLFFGESSSRSAISQLRQALSADVAGLSTYTAVGQLGFRTERDGTVTVTDATLDAALSTNYAAVKALFINQATSTGVAQRINAAVDALDDVGSGTLTVRKDGLSGQIRDLTAEIGRKEDALTAYEERLRIQYAALDSLLRQLQGQSSAIQAQQ